MDLDFKQDFGRFLKGISEIDIELEWLINRETTVQIVRHEVKDDVNYIHLKSYCIEDKQLRNIINNQLKVLFDKLEIDANEIFQIKESDSEKAIMKKLCQIFVVKHG